MKNWVAEGIASDVNDFKFLIPGKYPRKTPFQNVSLPQFNLCWVKAGFAVTQLKI